MSINSRLTLALLLTLAAGVERTEGQDRKAAAESLWNQAVAAKGGRVTLESVRNLVVTERTTYTRTRLREYDPGFTRQRLYVFPSKLWQFVDHRPGKLGFTLSVLDLEHPVLWSVSGPFPASQGTIDG